MELKSFQHLSVVLASSATWRSEALTRLGIPHQCVAPAYAEPAYTQGHLEEHVMQLALGKARSVTAPGSVVIGLDQMIEIEKKVLGKPGSDEAALAQLQLLNGKKHRLVNGLAVVYGKQEILQWDESFLTMRSLSQGELEYYLQKDQPFDCAGSYQIESLGSSLFESVEVKDLGSVLGLPGILILNALRQLGYSNLLPLKLPESEG